MRDRELRQGYGARDVLPRLAQGASFSGSERNHLFLNRGADGFTELSGVSGLDHPADGRAFAVLDFDRDGKPDFAVVNANEPRFQLFRNRIGESPGAGTGSMIALRLVGGAETAESDPGWSTRDGYGARVTVELKDRTLVREHRAGEGLAAQNSAVLLIGVGDADVVPRVAVRWPSGRESFVENVAAGTEVTLFERDTVTPVTTSYRREAVTAAAMNAPRLPTRDPLPLDLGAGGEPLRIFLTLATWCEACVDDLGALKHLRSAFPEGQVGFYGVPIDPNDETGALDDWVSFHRPPYRVLTGLGAAEREAVQAYVTRALGVEAVPATLVTDRDGRVLLTRFGIPSVSQIRQMQANLP